MNVKRATRGQKTESSERTISEIFYDYRARLENHPQHNNKTPMHRKNMAIRYMVKMFLKDLWVAWRTLEGLPVTTDYAEAKLGLKHGEGKSDE